MPTRKVCLTVAYDGSRFHGWQLQPGLRTVQGELTRRLAELFGEEVGVEGASRTDTGVHAYGQAAIFSTSTPIPTERLTMVINPELPGDLRVRAARDVPPDFHPRSDALGKLYRYTFRIGPDDDPFIGRFVCRLRRRPDVEAMRRAAPSLLGEHDFAAFQNRNDPEPASTVRQLYRVDVREDGCLLHLDVVGNGFLYKMVRNIAGTLLYVGEGKLPAEELAAVLASADRTRAGATALPEGLALVQVLFEDDELRVAREAPETLDGFLSLLPGRSSSRRR